MGASPVFVRFSEVGPFASAFWRVMLGLPFLFMWAVFETAKDNRKINWTFNGSLLLSGLFFAGDLFFWHLAIKNTTMANATLFATLAPAWVILFSKAFIGEPVSRNAYFGLGFCLFGAILLAGSSFQLAPERIIGDLFGFITSIFFGLYFLAIRVGRRTRNAGELTFLSTIVTCVILFAITIIASDKLFPDTINGFFSLLSLGAISHAGGQGLLSVALGALSAAFSSLVIFVEAIAGAFLGWLIFNEALSNLQILGGLFILFGVWISRPRNQE